VLTEAAVSRILFDGGETGKDLVANGLEFVHGGKTYTVSAEKEIILSAGQALEYISLKYVYLSVQLQHYQVTPDT
jgi:hypothetical protein